MYTQFDSIIFDIDGTLWDSTDAVAVSYNKVFEREGLDVRVDGPRLKELFGKPMDVIFSQIFPGMSPEEIARLSNDAMVQENDDLAADPCECYPQVPETLAYLCTRLPLFIVSNCQSGYIEILVEGNHLEAYIKDFLCFGDTGLSKDQTILRLMEKNQLKNPVYVGDTQGDADACAKAGIPIIHCAYGFGQVENPFDTIHSFAELKDLF